MKKLIIAISVIAVLATSGLALAQGWGRGWGMGMGDFLSGYGPNPEDACPRFNPATDQALRKLSPEQQEQLNTFRRGYRPDGYGYRFGRGMGYGRAHGMGHGMGSRW